MINPFFWYSCIWSAVLLLYDLQWSDMNTSMNPALRIFLLVSIIVSFILGYFCRNVFQYRETEDNPADFNDYTLIICILGLLEFVYAKNVPLIAILMGRRGYGDFQGIPLLHTFLENAVVFYSGYIYYNFLKTNRKRYLMETISLISILILMFHKGTLIFCLFIIFNLTIAKLRTQQSVFSPKILSYIIVVVFMILYLNGGLTNLRSGCAWNDCHIIELAGQINSNWPVFIPKQICWAYSYITSPVANLNLIINHYDGVVEISRMVLTVVPVFLSKRLFPELIVNGSKEFILYTPILNACTGYAESGVTGGIVGCIFFWIVFIIIQTIVATKLKRDDLYYSAPIMAITSMLSAFIFFYNTLTTAATSLLFIYIFLSIGLNKKVLMFGSYKI